MDERMRKLVGSGIMHDRALNPQVYVAKRHNNSVVSFSTHLNSNMLASEELYFSPAKKFHTTKSNSVLVLNKM